MSNSRRRKEAFANAMRLNGRPFDAFDLSPGGTDNNAVKRWLANLPKPCGIFAASDAVAERCGYASIAHFRDTFRKITGHNPLEWRRLSR